MSWRRLFAIMLKEVRQLRRDRLTLGMVLGIPVIQLLLFGFAINLDVRRLPAAIADESATAASRALVQDLLASSVIERHAEARSAGELRELLRRGRISVGVFVPHDFERRRAEGREAVQILVDGSDSAVLNAARQLSQLPTEAMARIQPAIVITGFYNPERRSAVNIVPGLIGVILTLTMVLFTAVAIVRERERGDVNCSITTPPLSSTTDDRQGVALHHVLGLIQTGVVLLLGAWVFAVPIRGALTDVFFAALLLIAANLSLGLLISTQAKSPVPGDANDVLRVPAIDPALRLHVPVRGHAEVRAVDRRGLAPDALHAPDPRCDAAGCGPGRSPARGVGPSPRFTLVMMSMAILRFRKRLD